jgi:hypothetical protein
VPSFVTHWRRASIFPAANALNNHGISIYSSHPTMSNKPWTDSPACFNKSDARQIILLLQHQMQYNGDERNICRIMGNIWIRGWTECGTRIPNSKGFPKFRKYGIRKGQNHGNLVNQEVESRNKSYPWSGWSHESCTFCICKMKWPNRKIPMQNLSEKQ